MARRTAKGGGKASREARATSKKAVVAEVEVVEEKRGLGVGDGLVLATTLTLVAAVLLVDYLLGKRGVVNLLVEGGGSVHGQLLAAGLVDRMEIFVAPKLIGAGGVPLVSIEGPDKMSEAWQLEQVSVLPLGDDVLISGSVGSGRYGTRSS